MQPLRSRLIVCLERINLWRIMRKIRRNHHDTKHGLMFLSSDLFTFGITGCQNLFLPSLVLIRYGQKLLNFAATIACSLRSRQMTLRAVAFCQTSFIQGGEIGHCFALGWEKSRVNAHELLEKLGDAKVGDTTPPPNG